MIVSLDTNVLVSGVLSGAAPPGQIVDLVVAGRLRVGFDFRVTVEYRQVLHRPRFRLKPSRIEVLLDAIESEGLLVVCEPTSQRLPDITDEKFLEVAIAADARCLVTGNLRHYPSTTRCGVHVVSPRQFIDMLRHEGLGT